MEKPVSDWIKRYVPAPEAPSVLVCLPHAGGSATFYLPVARMASTWADVLAVQYPGRQERRAEPCLDSVAELADGVAQALGPWTDRPLTLFGHSMGATVGYEVARRLEARGVTPLALFVSGRPAPSIPRDRGVHRRNDDGLMAELRGTGGTASLVLDDPDFMRTVLPAIRADYRAIETYRHPEGPVLSCPVTALVGDDDPKVGDGEAAAWNGHTRGRFALHTFTGGHFYLTAHVAEIVALMRAHTDEALRTRRAPA